MAAIKLGNRVYEGVDSVKMDEASGTTITFYANQNKLSNFDFSNLKNGSFTETIEGKQIKHTITFDVTGKPATLDGVDIEWGDDNG